MTLIGKSYADGLVYVTCPDEKCKTTLRIKPKSAKTTVTCAKCGNRFPLEVSGVESPAKAPAVPPPLPNDNCEMKNAPAMFGQDEAKRGSLPPPKPKKVKQPWEVDDEERRRERRREPEKKSTPIGMILGIAVAAVLFVSLGAFGMVYVMRDKPGKNPTTPVAANSTTDQTTNPFAPTGIEPAKDDNKSSANPTGAEPKNEVTPAKKEPEPAGPIVKEDPPKGITRVSEQEPQDGPKGKSPKKKNPAPKGGPAVTGGVIDRVKKSTALIEAKGGWGTGFVIRPGIVMTNTHVIAGKIIDDLRVSFVSLDDTAPPALKATLLYTDPRRDLAILRVDTDRPPLEICDSGTELKGLEVAIVGNPKGDAGQAEINKVTTGRLNNPIRRDAGWTYYELSAQAYFGNSGGPVVDAKTGKLVGVVQSILGDGKQKSYCIPYGEALRALESLPSNKEDEPKATKIALGRHYLEYMDDHLPEMELNAEDAMAGQLIRLQAKSVGATVTITVRTIDGRSASMTLSEFMDVLRSKHGKTYPTFTKTALPAVNASSEIPSPVKQLMRERIESYVSMYSLANQSTNTEKAFRDAMDARKAANVKKAKAFKEAYDKFLDDLERKPIVKPK